MSQTLNPTLSKAKEASFAKQFDVLLLRLRENNRATLEIRKEIDKLKRTNERSFHRVKKAVEALEQY